LLLAAEKVAVVAGGFRLADVTVPGPLTLLQAMVRLPLTSVAVPASMADPGSVIVRSGPALTTDTSFTALTVIVTVATLEAAVPSLTLKVKLSAPLKFAFGV
jgi:hypothetical protein